MKLQNEFTVEAPVEEAWDVLLDLERVTPCLPGASLEEASGGNGAGSAGDEYKGTMTVRLGPVTQKYNGTVRIEEADESARRAVIRAEGKDARGQGTASATITSTLNEENGGTRVVVETDMHVTGKAAQFGRGVQQEIAAKLINRFAECLGREIMGENVREEPEPAASAAGNSAGAASGAAGVATNGSGGEAQGSGGDSEQPRRRIINQPEPEPLDLGEASREAVLKRAIPAAAVLGVLVLVFLVIRKRRS